GGKVEHVVHVALHMEVVGDVVVDQAELTVLEEVVDVARLAGDHVVDGGHLRSRLDEGSAHVGSEEPCAAEHDGVLPFEWSPVAQVRHQSSNSTGTKRKGLERRVPRSAWLA